MRRSPSLRLRIAATFAAAFICTLAVIFITLHVALENLLVADLDGDLERFADSLIARIVVDNGLIERDEVGQVVTALLPGRLDSGLILVAVRNPEGTLIAASSPVSPDVFTARSMDVERLRGGAGVRYTVKNTEQHEFRVLNEPVMLDGQLVAVVQATASLGPITSALSRLQTLLVIMGMCATLVTTLVGYLIARRGLKPLEQVARLAADIEAHDLTRRLHLVHAPVEIARLADTFDAMLERIERAFALQRNFALDVAHELRTPLTALRGNLDVLLLDPDLTDDLRGEIQRLANETGRMMRLTSNLLSLAQAEAGRTVARRLVELDLVCLEVYQQARVLRAGVRLRLGHEDQVVVSGDSDLLKQLVLNLVENGMKYTPAGGAVTLSLYREGGQARIVVTDSGFGITAEHLPHIFERFYRAPPGGGRIAGGAGIGLAVARWIAEQHGGRIEVKSSPGSGSTFTVILPLAGAPAGSGTSSDSTTGAGAPVISDISEAAPPDIAARSGFR